MSQGLTLSGCEQESSNAELAARVKERDENAAKAIYVASDTAGSLFTGAPNGGMVLIAGEYILWRESQGIILHDFFKYCSLNPCKTNSIA